MKLDAWREKHGVTLEQLCERIPAARRPHLTTIWRLERGHIRRPDITLLRDIEAATKRAVRVADLLPE